MEKIKLIIGGEYYNINTDDDPEYLEQLGKELDGKINALVQSNSRVSVTQAAVLTALEYIDLYKKSERDCDNLRTQIQAYLEDAARNRTDAELARREVAALKKELEALGGLK
ncbi:MAG: cell division protein ZapA [Clostridia bacterium]|jgi:cell division protein ZapA|nr:cell division protein ZapA [Clostridia bacterium]